MYQTIRQNKLIHSQHLRGYFEKEIDRYNRELESKEIDVKDIGLKKSYNRKELIDLIYELKITLFKNEEYLQDFKKFKLGELIEIPFIANKSYFMIATLFSVYAGGLENLIFFKDIDSLLDEINESNLSNADSKQLKSRIERELIGSYLSFLESEKNSPTFRLEVPIFSLKGSDLRVEFKLLGDTNFGDYYKRFKLKLSQSV